MSLQATQSKHKFLASLLILLGAVGCLCQSISLFKEAIPALAVELSWLGLFLMVSGTILLSLRFETRGLLWIGFLFILMAVSISGEVGSFGRSAIGSLFLWLAFFGCLYNLLKQFKHN